MPEMPRQLHEKIVAALKFYDDESRDERAERILWTDNIRKPTGIILGRLEPLSLLEEARVSFINGTYIAALLAATSFIDHALADLLRYEKVSAPDDTLNSRIETAQKYAILPAEIVKGLDWLRKIRNPFVHPKPRNPMTLSRRYLKEGKHPQSILEADAKKAILLMYEIYWRSTIKEDAQDKP